MAMRKGRGKESAPEVETLPVAVKEEALQDWSHARDVAEGVEARVEYIEGLMSQLLWERGKSARRLAELWQTPLSTVQNYSAEASRHVSGDADEARRDITVGARRLLRDAIQNGDALAFKQVADVWATVSGAKAPEQHHVVTETAEPKDVARLVREAFGEKALPKKPNGLNGHANGAAAADSGAEEEPLSVRGSTEN
jgi:hypothetical protein